MGRGRLGGAKRIMPPSPSTRIYRPAHLRHGLAGCASASRRRSRAATLLDTGRPPPTAHPIRPRRIAFGRNAAGQTARAGGWGYVFGDEGGGVDIVRQAVRAALRMEENWGPPTSLRQALLDATGQASANRVLHLFYTPDWPRSRAAALASLVDSAAAEGDAVALRILESAAQELALLGASVRAQLWLPGKPVDVAYIGGVFASQRLLEHYRMLVEFEAGNRCAAPLRGPAEGALLEALRSAGIQTRLL